MESTEIEILKSNYAKCQKALNEVLNGDVWQFMTVHTDEKGNTTTQGGIYTAINKEEFIASMQKENAILVEAVQNLMFELKKANREIDTLITTNREFRKESTKFPLKSMVLISGQQKYLNEISVNRIYFEQDFRQAEKDLELINKISSPHNDADLFTCEIYNNKTKQTDEK